MADYKRGTDDPRVPFDIGAGVWGSKKATKEMQAQKLIFLGLLKHPLVKFVIGENARNHLRYYFRNEGKRYEIESLKKMVKDVGAARKLYDKELAEARAFVERLPVGRHFITSERASKGYNGDNNARDGGDRNWYYAVGGYSAWGKGEATVIRYRDGQFQYQLEFEYKFADRYNWNIGANVHIGPLKITDRFMAEFHRQGLAKEFNMYGSWKKTYTWIKN